MDAEKSCQELDRFIDYLPVGIIIFDNHIQVKRWNTMALDLLGLGVEDLLCDSIVGVIENEQLKSLILGGQLDGGSEQHLVIESKGLSLNCTIKHTSNDGSGDIILIVEDATRLREIENIKRDFIATILHKVRNPLSTLKTSLSMMQGDRIPGLSIQSKEILSMSYHEVNRLSTLVNDLKDLFLIETGLAKNDMDIERINVHAALQKAIVELEKSQTLQRGFGDRILVEGSKDLNVVGDFEKVIKIFFVVIKNAICYSAEESKVEVSITKAHGAVSIRIRDAGIGIMESNVPKVFGKYFREDNHLTRRIGGNGLGLFIAKSYANLMNGSIFFESKQDVWSLFCINLPEADDRKEL